jgi:hypothetical protein
MRVLGYTWAGVRTADLKSAARFFADTLGFSVIHKGEGLVQFELPSGQLFEVFGSIASRLPSSGFSGGGCAGGQEGVAVTRCRVRHRCRWQRIRGLDLFSRPRRLPIRALADRSPFESAARPLTAKPTASRLNEYNRDVSPNNRVSFQRRPSSVTGGEVCAAREGQALMM